MSTTAKHWLFAIASPTRPLAAAAHAADGELVVERDASRGETPRDEEDSRMVRRVAQLFGIEEGRHVAAR